MTNIAIIENKITAVQKYLKQAAKYKKYTKEEIEQSADLSGAVERYLYLAVQSCIDLAEAVVSFKDFRKPTTYQESFEILAEEGVLDANLVGSMARMTGFRNIIAHDYEKIDYNRVYDILQNRLADIEVFVVELKKYLNVR